MSIEIIDLLKPKNGGNFPIVEAIDVWVEGFDNLADAVSHFATDAMIEAITEVLSGKANVSDVNTAVTNLQNQINQIEISASAESVVAPEVVAARVGADSTSYQTLKARLDAESAKAFQFRGELSDLNYMTIAEANQVGCYNSRSATTEIISDKPDGVTGAFSLYVNKWSTGEALGTVQLLISATGSVYQRFLSYSGTVLIDWASTSDTSSQFRGELAALGYTSISQARKIGCYSSLTTTTAVLPDKPDGVTGAFSLIVNNWLSDGSPAPVQILITRTGDVWQRFLNANGNVVIDWASSATTIAEHTDSIAELKSEIYDTVDIPMNLTSGKFWDVSGEEAELKDLSGWFASDVIPVTEGEVYTVYADQGSSHKTRIWTLCDDELNILARAEDVYSDVMSMDTFTVIHGATKLVITHKSHTPDVPYLKKTQPKFEKLDNDIAAIQSEINDLKNEDYTQISFSLEVGGFTAAGLLDNNTTKRARTTYFLPCNPLIGTIHFPANSKHKFVYYEDNQYSACWGMSEWSTDTEDEISYPEYHTRSSFCILFGYNDDRTITASNLPDIWFEYNAEEGNKITGLTGYNVNTNMPAIGTSSAYSVSPIVPVISEKEYKATKFRNTLLLDENLEPTRVLGASDITDNTIAIGATEKYICWCWKNEDCSEMYFAEKDKYVEGTTVDELVPIPLTGKKLSLLGDSISAYTGTIPAGNDVYYTGSNSGVSAPEQMWWSVLCGKTGMQPLVINGWSGSGVTQLTDSSHSSKVPMSDITRDQALHSGTTNPDVVIIAGGVNDYTYAEQASQCPNNWDGTTAPIKGNSFTETYACMIKEIQTAYPSAIVICLSTWFTMRGTDNGFTLVNGEGFTQSDYDREIERVASLMRVPFIDVAKCGFNRANFYPTYAEDSSTIPTHPNARGQRVMGEYLADLIPPIIHSFVSNLP